MGGMRTPTRSLNAAALATELSRAFGVSQDEEAHIFHPPANRSAHRTVRSRWQTRRENTTMPYPEMLVAPMRRDLVRIGFTELRTPEEVDRLLAEGTGTVLLAINSVCGCSAANMRPGVALAMENPKVPSVGATVFAGQDLEATEQARRYFTGYPPSSPSIALLSEGELVYMMERHQIEGRGPHEIAHDLRRAFDAHC